MSAYVRRSRKTIPQILKELKQLRALYLVSKEAIQARCEGDFRWSDWERMRKKLWWFERERKELADLEILRRIREHNKLSGEIEDMLKGIEKREKRLRELESIIKRVTMRKVTPWHVHARAGEIMGQIVQRRFEVERDLLKREKMRKDKLYFGTPLTKEIEQKAGNDNHDHEAPEAAPASQAEITN